MIFRLEHGADISKSITEFCVAHKIKSGLVLFIGAVFESTIGYYDQTKKKYKKISVKKPMEIVSGIGNISMKDNNPFLHAHISLADKSCKMIGGHLFSPTRVFACEVAILTGKKALSRQYDDQTGLFLWKFGSRGRLKTVYEK